MNSSTPGLPVHHQLPDSTMSIESVMSSNHLILCRPLLLLPLIFPSIMAFSNESALLIRCQSIVASASASVLPMNNQGWFPLGLTGLISLLFKGFSRVFSNTTVWKYQFRFRDFPLKQRTNILILPDAVSTSFLLPCAVWGLIILKKNTCCLCAI